MRLFFGFILFACPLLISTSLFAESRSLREGAEAFRQGDFAKAAEAFDQAQRESPNDPRIVFNQGAALAAAGRFDEAVEMLRRSAVAQNSDVAAKSLTLLGQIAIDRAKELLSPQQEATPPEQRQKVLDQLQIAERFYMESHEADPSDRSIGPILEQIRAWRSHIETVWGAVDRLQKRQQDTPDRLRWLEDWQQKLGDSIGPIMEEPDSPKKCQEFYDTARQQHDLVGELAAIRNDLQQKLTEEKAPQPTNGHSDPEHPILQELDRLRDSASRLEQSLLKFQGKESQDAARETVNGINRLRINLSPFDVIAQEAEKKQAALRDANPDDLVPTEGETPKTSPDILALRDDPLRQTAEQEDIARWMPLMTYRAKQGLQGEPSPEVSPSGGGQSAEQAEARKKSMELAVQYGPEIQTLATEAAGALRQQAFENARPKQQRALELLREILEPLRDQQQNQQQQGQQQQDRQQQGGEGKDQRQDQKSQDSNQEKQESEKKKDEQKQDRDKNEPSEAEQEKEQESSPSKPSGKEMTPREKKEELDKAERMLRQVKRKQQDAEERRERVRALLRQAEPVQKDW